MADIDYSIKDLEKFIKLDGVVKNVEYSRLTAPGENYLSLVLRVNFEIEKDGVTKTFSTVTKRLPMVERKSNDFNSQAMTNEIKWYTDYVRLVKDFAREIGIEELPFFPEYCGSRYSLNPTKKEADKDSFLVLENLIPQGFKNEDRYKGFDLITSKAVLKNLAQFHAVPLVMKFKEPEKFKILREYLESNVLKPPVFNEDEPEENQTGSPPRGKGPEDLVIDVMLNMPQCAPYVDKLKLQLEKPKGPETWLITGPEPWNTILHNDFWVNNIMIKCIEGSEPSVKIVDFQWCTYGSYARDLVFFLLTSVRNDVTTKYLDDLLKYYYEVFTSILIQANVELELTFTAFLKEVRRVTFETEFNHIMFFTTIVFGEKNSSLDPVLEEFDPVKHVIDMIERMNQLQKDKLAVIATEAGDRNWI